MADSGEQDETPQTDASTNKEPPDIIVTSEEYAEAKAWLAENFPNSWRDPDVPLPEIPGKDDYYMVDPAAYTDIPGEKYTREAFQSWDWAAKQAVANFFAEELGPEPDDRTKRHGRRLGRKR